MIWHALPENAPALIFTLSGQVPILARLREVSQEFRAWAHPVLIHQLVISARGSNCDMFDGHFSQGGKYREGWDCESRECSLVMSRKLSRLVNKQICALLALRRFATAKDQDAIDVVSASLKAGDQNLQKAALLAAQAFKGHQQTLQNVLETLQGGEHHTIRLVALRTLDKLEARGNMQVIQTMLQTLQSGESHHTIRLMAMRILVKLEVHGNMQVIQTVVGLLDACSSHTLLEALHTLSEIVPRGSTWIAPSIGRAFDNARITEACCSAAFQAVLHVADMHCVLKLAQHCLRSGRRPVKAWTLHWLSENWICIRHDDGLFVVWDFIRSFRVCDRTDAEVASIALAIVRTKGHKGTTALPFGGVAGTAGAESPPSDYLHGRWSFRNGGKRYD